MSNGTSALLNLFIASARERRPPFVYGLFDCDQDISTTYDFIGPKFAMYIQAPNKRNILILLTFPSGQHFNFQINVPTDPSVVNTLFAASQQDET